MKYIVIKRWHDLQDNNYQYEVGDIYPREGLEPSENRILELSSSNNIPGIPLIKLMNTSNPEDGVLKNEFDEELENENLEKSLDEEFDGNDAHVDDSSSIQNNSRKTKKKVTNT
ncbi:hypothetical protein PT204_07660 [Erysipelothrix rhusiopathiae]|uniref:hypothetical protein n=1 Tax=Erysipelothrix rhusiopathiae TaxID=1648 RepID=UPI0023AFBD5F|nr:hypothetical protein [Erysipelothrix rhusiopathiae]MDE8123714.1 hypothetical protein [Erysipelothrix rhusiopathiae]MDE8219519.1 hypothetical protein [Erysipelothrix rhusiopathiae]MDE8224736.1 hypothetical protein [Erysipelothrix rhusiopathiae]MDE8259124.1 hypothetical protein [Erysipelothrix rhusiopathiae]MDE9420587.1 hypothetical protein [Erysipelothrix rhusiopathiae]